MISRDLRSISAVQIVDYILPVLLPKMPTVVVRSAGGTAGGGGGALTAHALSDTTVHTGALADVQAPQFLKLDGTRALTGDLGVANGVKIDGVDISAHAQDPDAHHAKQHSIIGGDHTLPANTPKWSVVGTTAVDTLGLLPALADVTGTTKEALLRSDDNGHLSLVRAVASDRLRAPVIDTAVGSLTLQPVNELVINPAGGVVRLAAGKLIKSNSFASGFAGNGWQIDDGVMEEGHTSAEFDNLTIRGLLRVYELLISKIRTGNGSYLFSDGGKVASVAGAGPYTLTFDEDHGFAAGDLIRAQKFLGGAYISRCTVSSTPTTKTAVVTLNSGSAPAAGYEYARVGSTSDANRRGSVYVTSNDSGAPFLDVIDGIASHANWGTAGKVRVRLGKLTGVTGVNAYGLFSGDNGAAWISTEAVNGFRVGFAGATRLQADMNGNLRLFNSAGEAVIALDIDGSSYFANIMTIGLAGEIRQGTGLTGTQKPGDAGASYTGLRIWRDGNIGRIGGYKSNILQWYGDTLGELRAGGGLVAMAGDGYNMARYATEVGAPIAGTESKAALAWWDDINSRTGAPIARAYAGRSSAGTGAVPSLALEVDPGNSNVNRRGSIWLAGNDPAYASAPSLRLYNIFTVLGIPGIYAIRNPTTLADSVYFSGSLYLQAHLLRDPLIAGVDIGTAGNPFRKLYVAEIVADTITGGTALAGAVWQNDAGDMYVRSSSAAARTLFVANPGAGLMHLDVEGNIVVGGLLDGVDLAALKTAYDSHIVDYAGHIGNADAHHAKQHSIIGGDHTASGLTAGQVIRASGATTFTWAQLGHGDLGGVTADQHHAQVHVLANAAGLGADHTIGGASAGWVLRATSSTAARMAQLMVTDLGASGAAWDVVSLTGANMVGLRTPSSDVASGIEGLLKSNAAGEIALAGLKIGAGAGAMIFSGNGNIANFPDIQFGGNAFLATEGSLYISLDSDSATLDNNSALIIGHDSPTTVGFATLFTFDEAGTATITGKVRVPLIDTATGSLTIAPAGDVVFDPVGNDVLPALNYDINLGAITKKYLTLHAAELWVETLVAQDTIATIGGRILVGPTTTLTRDLGSAAGDTTIYVKHNQMSSGDRVYMEAAGKVEFMAVTSAPTLEAEGDYSYTVTRNLDGTGRNLWYAGDAVFNTGQVGNGFIDLYSLSGIPRAGQSGQRAGPTIVGNVRTGTAYNAFRERWAVGNLNALYDYANNEYGAAFGNPLSAWIGMDEVNGVRIMDGTRVVAKLDITGNFALYNGSGVATIALDANGSSYFANVMTIGASGEIRQGTGVLGTDYTGLRIWRQSNVGRIAGYNNNNLQWYMGTDGKWYFGAGNGIADALGLVLKPTTGFSDVPGSILAWYDTPSTRTGFAARIAAGAFDLVGNRSGIAFEIAGSAAGGLNPGLWFKEGALYRTIYHSGNMTWGADGLLKTSAGGLVARNATDTGYVMFAAEQIFVNNGYISSPSANGIQFWKSDGSAFQQGRMGSLMVSNDGAHYARVPANGIYSHGGLVVGSNISSYSADLYIGRAGVQKLALYTWGTYVYDHLTLEDVLGITTVQATEPVAPASGVKIYLMDRAGVVKLEAKFANGAVRALANN